MEGNIYLDEIYYSVRLGDRQLKEDGTEPKGLLINKICIGVACISSRIVCVIEGRAKPSKNRTWDAFGHAIAPRSNLIHDGEKSHRILVDSLDLTEEVYKAKDLIGLSDEDNPLRRVNAIHRQLKNFLYAHNNFDRKNLQGYLGLFSFISNPPKDPLEKVELMFNLTFKIRKNIHYRDFYSLENE